MHGVEPCRFNPTPIKIHLKKKLHSDLDKLCTIEKSVKFYVIYDRPVPRKPFYVPLRIQRKQTMSKMRKKKSRCGLINHSVTKSLIRDRHRPCYSRVTYFLRIILVLSLYKSAHGRENEGVFSIVGVNRVLQLLLFPFIFLMAVITS